MLRAILGGLALEAEWQLISILDRKCSAQCQQIMSFYSHVLSTWRKWYIVSIWMASKPHIARCIPVFWNKIHGLSFMNLSASSCNIVHAWTQKLFLLSMDKLNFRIQLLVHDCTFHHLAKTFAIANLLPAWRAKCIWLKIRFL